ncbi:MAG: hypothetical protein R3C49_10725 [Planctomycetaceae bacterium]
MIALFVLKLPAGISLMWWLMPRRDVTDGFFRIQMRLLLGLTVLSSLLLTAGATWTADSPGTTVGDTDGATVGDSDLRSSESENLPADRLTADRLKMLDLVAAAVAYAGSVFWALGRRLPGNLCIHLLALLCCGALLLHSLSIPGPCPDAVQVLSDFSSAAVLGGMLTGMLLGHWYLTTPTMSIQPLWWFNRAIAIAAMLRLLASALSLYLNAWPREGTQQIWLGIRWTGGIAAPLLVTLLVWRILVLRNTQSATGVLFAGLILVFMGEMTAALLERDAGFPF